MATIVIFHSVMGLRSIELSAVARLQALGHSASAPDLFGGQTATTADQGFKIMDMTGWDLICNRARAALDRVPSTAVLLGFSMGAGVISALWPERPKASGVLLMHGLADIPLDVDVSIPIQVHLADPDPFVPAHQLQEWNRDAESARVSAEVFLYPNVGHFFTDTSLHDFDAHGAELAWNRVEEFLEALGTAGQ